jgi:hypothetical protein
VLGGNLAGCTSFLLGLDGGKLAGDLKLDLLVPVRGFKRCVDPDSSFGGLPGATCAALRCAACPHTLHHPASPRAQRGLQGAPHGPSPAQRRRRPPAEFQYPAQWLADQTLLRRQAQRAEEGRALDLPPLARSRERARRRDVVEPSAAFGPAGTT